MAEENAVFLCKVCKPITNESKTKASKKEDSIKCKRCNFKSTIKYNFRRHVDRVHGGIDEPEIDEPETQIVNENEKTESVEINEVQDDTIKEITMEEFLKELNLEHFLENFVSEGVDLKMLISLNLNDLKECLKEVGVW